MVLKTLKLFAKARNIPRKYLKVGFRDSLKINVNAGAGGNGYPKYGGIGGQGGDVVIVAKENITLEDVFKQNKSKRYAAKNGTHSNANFIIGPPGDHVQIDVPVGVALYSEEGQKIGELNTEGEQLLIAKGGVGGHPKNGFLGTKGQTHTLHLDLKLIADIGLVGFPNAGKSTLLGAISHAKPKIASYPFTTIRPNVGTIMYKDLRQIAMADLPGLIEGAHANKGMGHNFLKHVERTKLLLLVVDINGFRLGPQYPQRSCLDTIVLLNKELEMYKPELLEKPAMIIVNKMDSEGALETYKDIKHHIQNLNEIIPNYEEALRPEKALKFTDVLPISAKNSPEDIEMVKKRLRRLLDVMAEIDAQNTENSFPNYNDFKKKHEERGPRLI